MNKRIEIAVCMPQAGDVKPETVHSLIALDLPRPFHFLDRREASVADARNHIVGRILTDPALAAVTHLLWIDDDMVFSQDAARRLLAHDVPIIGGLCFGRRAPSYSPILLHYKDDPKDTQPFYQYDYEGVVEVDGTGAAFLLVKREVYEAIEQRFPAPGEGPFSDMGHGEDVSMCKRAKACGYKTLVDTDVKIGHVGKVVVDEEFAKHNRRFQLSPWTPVNESKDGPPVASVIIPTYNQHPKHLKAAVRSALAQTVPVEVIVVDDGSSPHLSAKEVLHGQLGEEFDTVRIIEHEQNKGCFPALNTGIRAARTEYVAFLPSDDTYYPPKIARQRRAMANRGVHAAFHGYDLIDVGGASLPGMLMPMPWKSAVEAQQHLREGCYVSLLTVMLHRSVFETVGYFDESFQISSDWEFWNRIAQAIFWLPISEILATRREMEENASNRYAANPEKQKQWMAEDARVREMYAYRCAKCGG